MYWLDMDTLRHCPSAKKPLQLLSIDRLANTTIVLDAEQCDFLSPVAEPHTSLAPMHPHGTEFFQPVAAKDNVITVEWKNLHVLLEGVPLTLPRQLPHQVITCHGLAVGDDKTRWRTLFLVHMQLFHQCCIHK
jgi:hypothetical protein